MDCTNMQRIKALHSHDYHKILRGYDADMLSLASFGTDSIAEGNILGVQEIITLDKHFMTKYHDNHCIIHQRFNKMIENLANPFCNTSIPEIRLLHGEKF